MIPFGALMVALVAALAGAEPPAEPPPQTVTPITPAEPPAPVAVPFAANQGEVYEIASGKGRVQMMLPGPNYMGIIEGAPGLVVPEHEHPDAVELLYVLEGSGWMIVGGKRQQVTAGMAIQVPKGVKHSFMIPPDATAGFRAVQVYTPAGPEQRFKQGRKLNGGE